MRDVRGDVVRRQLKADHGIDVSEVRSITGFLIKSSVPSFEISERVDDLFSDPIIEDAVTDTLFLTSPQHFPTAPDAAITVGFKPGVTDNPGSAAYDGFRTIFTQDELLEDAETVLEENSQLLYYDRNGLEQHTHQITILSIDTDEGVLDPLGVGEILIEVRY